MRLLLPSEANLLRLLLKDVWYQPIYNPFDYSAMLKIIRLKNWFDKSFFALLALISKHRYHHKTWVHVK